MATLRVPDVVPSPTEDCQRLRKAFEGLAEKQFPFCPCLTWLGTDEKAIIDVLGRRNASQRKMIRETYQHLYKKSLIEDLHSEFSGDFKKAVILWTYDPCERDARLANEAICTWKKGIREVQVIVEIACASSPNHLMYVRKAYCSLFSRSIEEDILISNLPLPVQKILLNLVTSYRYDKELVDSAIAISEAAVLHDAIELRNLEVEELVFICSTRNFFQLRQTFQHYKHNYGNSIEEDILNFGKGLLESVLKVAISCIESPEKHFAEVISASIIGLGTDEDSLTRVIVTRSETDLMKVREEYFNANKSSLESAFIGDTSGNYKKFLMTLLGAKI